MHVKTTLLAVAVAGAALVASQLPAGQTPEGLGRGPEAGKARMWEHLERRLDQDGDGRITAEEWNARAAERFGRLDQDGDGVITESEIASLDVPRPPRMGGFLFRRADTDDNQEVSAAEWRAFLALLDPNADGVIETAEIEGAFARPEGVENRPGYKGHRRHHEGPPRLLDRDDDGVLETADLDAVFAELDANDDGALTSDELPRFRHRRHGRFHHRHAPDGIGDGAVGEESGN